MEHAPRVGRGAALGTLVAVVLLALNLRAAISSVSPVLDDLQASFGLSGTAMGLLTTLPVLSLGVFAGVAPPLARRFGAEATLVGALLLIAAGIVLRLTPYAASLFAGTALAGAGIAIVNVLMPYVIKRAYPDRVGALTGISMMVMSLGAALAAGLAVPLDAAAGWRTALAIWAVPALLASAAWLPVARRSRRTLAALERPGVAASPDDEVRVLRNPLAWAVTGFLGMQSLTFYALMSWLPQIMRDHGYSAGTAGLMLSVLMMLGIPSGLAAPVLAARSRDQRVLTVGVLGLMAVGVAGLLLAPGAGWLWVIVLGFATGSAFPVAFTLITLRSANPAVAARVSGMAQTIGYLLAALGPLGFGILHGVSGGWTLPLTLLLLWLIPETAIALRAARPAHIGTPPAPLPVPLTPSYAAAHP